MRVGEVVHRVTGVGHRPHDAAEHARRGSVRRRGAPGGRGSSAGGPVTGRPVRQALRIKLADEVVVRLARRAMTAGVTPEVYAAELVEIALLPRCQHGLVDPVRDPAPPPGAGLEADDGPGD